MPRARQPNSAGAPSRRNGSGIRVVIADDHALLRNALSLVLASQPGIQVIAEAEDGREAVDAATEFRPDVLLMDVAMPGLNGIDATRQVLKRAPGTRVLLLSAYVTEDRVIDALASGASGYVDKSADLAELALAIQTVHRGNTYLSSSLSEEFQVADLLVKADEQQAGRERPALTEREREVLQLVAEGLSSQRIADTLVISLKTVEAHRSHIMRKLGARNRTDLIRAAMKLGLSGIGEAEMDGRSQRRRLG